MPRRHSTGRRVEKYDQDGRVENFELELRPILLPDGSFWDVPKGTLREPPPKPVEFLYLQHYYESAPGVSQDLASCATLEEKVDVLADEVAGLKHLLSGFADSFGRYARFLSDKHKEVQHELHETRTSYKGLQVISDYVQQQSSDAEEKLEALEKKFRTLKNVARTRPPHFKLPVPPRRVADPELTPEEQRTCLERLHAEQHEIQRCDVFQIARDKLAADSFLAQVLDPPALLPPSSTISSTITTVPAAASSSSSSGASDKDKGKGKEKAAATEPRIALKIEKLAEGLDAFRESVRRTQQLTDEGLVRLRHDLATDMAHIADWDTSHHAVTSRTANRGDYTKIVYQGVEKLDKWATSALAEASAPEPEHEPASTSTSALALVPASTSALTSASASRAGSPTLNGDVYAVQLDIAADKPLDELSRDEAIALLKALPLQVRIVPCQPGTGTSEEEGSNSDAAPAAPPAPDAGTSSKGKGKKRERDGDDAHPAGPSAGAASSSAAEGAERKNKKKRRSSGEEGEDAFWGASPSKRRRAPRDDGAREGWSAMRRKGRCYYPGTVGGMS